MDDGNGIRTRFAIGKWLVIVGLPLFGLYLIFDAPANQPVRPIGRPTARLGPGTLDASIAEVAYQLIWLSACGQPPGQLARYTPQTMGCQMFIPVPLPWLQAQLVQAQVLQTNEYLEPLAQTLDARCEIAIRQLPAQTVGLVCVENHSLYRAANNAQPLSARLQIPLGAELSTLQLATVR